MTFRLEICCFNIQSALVAQQAGAHRVELCADPANGGTTPSMGVIKTARSRIHIPLYPIIRPRGGDFLFSQDEIDIMKQDVLTCKQLGCDGVVVGLLGKEGTVDKKILSMIVQTAYPMGVTFHRAFDWSSNPFEALEDIIECGCERILTSGQQPVAMQGSGLINALVRQANNRIIIMAGSGLNSSNIAALANTTGCEEFHASARMKWISAMQFHNEAMHDDQSTVQADPAEITAMLDILKNKFSSKDSSTDT